MQKLYRRRKDGKFPVYKTEAERGDCYSVERVENKKTIIDKIPHVYDPVIDDSNYSIDFETKKHGSFGKPYQVDGTWRVKRDVEDRDLDKVNAEYWDAVRMDRNAELARTDVLIIRALEETLVGHDDLKDHRRKLRNITDPQLNGGKKDPKTIKVKKF